MRILLYIGIIFLGAVLGYWDKLPQKLLGKLSKLQYLSLLLLLFIMGINIGINDEVVNTFYKLGFQALVLAVLSIAFSILGVKAVSSYVIGKKKEEGEQ